MKEVKIGSASYRIGKMNAIEQFHIVRKLSPALMAFGKLMTTVSAPGGNPIEKMSPITDAIASMSRTDADFVLFNCLRVAQANVGKDAWVPVVADGTDVLMNSELQLGDMLQIVKEVVAYNLGNFTDVLGQLFPAVFRATKEDGAP